MSTRADDTGTGTVSDHLRIAAAPEVASQRWVDKRRALGGILIRKECWTLSLRAKLLVLAACVDLALTSIRFGYPFLAVTNRMQGEVLVVEGWVPRYALEQAVALFKGGEYRKIFQQTLGNSVHPVNNRATLASFVSLNPLPDRHSATN